MEECRVCGSTSEHFEGCQFADIPVQEFSGEGPSPTGFTINTHNAFANQPDPPARRVRVTWGEIRNGSDEQEEEGTSLEMPREDLPVFTRILTGSGVYDYRVEQVASPSELMDAISKPGSGGPLKAGPYHNEGHGLVVGRGSE